MPYTKPYTTPIQDALHDTEWRRRHPLETLLIVLMLSADGASLVKLDKSAQFPDVIEQASIQISGFDNVDVYVRPSYIFTAGLLTPTGELEIELSVPGMPRHSLCEMWLDLNQRIDAIDEIKQRIEELLRAYSEFDAPGSDPEHHLTAPRHTERFNAKFLEALKEVLPVGVDDECTIDHILIEQGSGDLVGVETDDEEVCWFTDPIRYCDFHENWVVTRHNALARCWFGHLLAFFTMEESAHYYLPSDTLREKIVKHNREHLLYAACHNWVYLLKQYLHTQDRHFFVTNITYDIEGMRGRNRAWKITVNTGDAENETEHIFALPESFMDSYNTFVGWDGHASPDSITGSMIARMMHALPGVSVLCNVDE